METFVTATTRCLLSAATTNAGPDEQFGLKSSKRGLHTSEFVGRCSPQGNSKLLLDSLTEFKVLTTGWRCSGLRRSSARFSQTLGNNFRFKVFCQVQQNFKERNSHLQHFPAGSSWSSSSRSSGDRSGNEATESGCDDGDRIRDEVKGIMAEKQGSNTGAVDHRAKSGDFHIGRRMLLGAVSVGLSYHSSSQTAQAADKDSKHSQSRGFWFLGDAEADMEPAEVDRGEKKEVGSGGESRVYDATALGEPVAIGTEKDRVWKKLLKNRVVYLGEAEKVADSDDKLLELEIVRTLRDRCFGQQRSVSLAIEAFPCPLQPQLNAYMNKKLMDEELREVASHLPEDHWVEYLPILQYCKNNGVRLVACGAPLEVLRTVQAKGVQAVEKVDAQKYIPSAGGGYKFKDSPLDDSGSVDALPNASGPFGPGPYRFAQARIVEDYTMAQVVTQIIKDGGAIGLLLVITGASHVQYGTRGTGLPAWIARNKEMQKRTQAVILLNPERQQLRKEGDVPEADFLWYSAAKVCTRNCFDRAEVARVMGAAGRRRDALPQDLQVGLKQGLVAPEVLQSFFELEQNPLMAELAGRFQGLRERWLADPRFLQRLAIEETISITTTLIAQYERRAGRFWKELDYVATDTIRGAVVDFFTVWLPAPRLSFREIDRNETFNALDSLKGLLGSFPDNAFQRPRGGENWGLGERVGGILVGGLKLFAVGFISAIGTSAGTTLFLNSRQLLQGSSQTTQTVQTGRLPIMKTALVYASFLATSANLRYQVIAGVIEHWIADYWLASQPLAGNALSFVTRVANSYFGTGQWVDIARFTGLQAHNDGTQSSTSNPTLEVSSDVVKTPELVEDIASNTVSTDQLQETLKVSKTTKYLGSQED